MAFLSTVLGKEVVSLVSKPIGAGLVGDSLQISLGYADGVCGPTSLAAKLPAADATSRGTAQSLQLYEKEVGFYRAIAPHIATRTPEIYFAEYDAESGDFLLLMEDCGPAEQGDQLEGCLLDQAGSALADLAALHGATFGQEQFGTLPFLQPNPQVRAFAGAGYPGATQKFIATYDGLIDTDLLTLVTTVGERSATLFAPDWTSSECVIHGDFRLDNMLFEINGGTEAIVTLDWQTVALGHPLTDVGYFMGAGIGSGLRRPNEDALLALYQRELLRHGGPDLGNIKEHHGYAKGALHGVTTAVFSAAFVEDNDRAKAIFQSMVTGAAELALDTGALRMLED